ncbi:MAG: HPr family phosphocarrier protein [Alphaproteobacteria bacterium]
MANETKQQAGQAAARCSGEVVIPNVKGLHARASAKFVKCAERFDAEVMVTREGQSVPGTSILGLMMLAAARGNTIVIEAVGPQAPDALKALIALVRDGFNEDN